MRGRRMIKELLCDILILHNIPGGSLFRPCRPHLMEIRALQPSSGLVSCGTMPGDGAVSWPGRGLGRDGSMPVAWLWNTPLSSCCGPVTDRLVLSAPLGPLPGAKDTDPPAQGPSCSRTRARIDFQMSRKSKQTKALHYLQSSLELSVMGTHREELCRRQSCSLPACSPISSLMGDSTQSCTELEPKAECTAQRKEGPTCSQRQGFLQIRTEMSFSYTVGEDKELWLPRQEQRDCTSGSQ